MPQGRLCWWVANVPVLSLLLTRKCQDGGSVVYPRWIWQRCTNNERGA